ncbi:MAG: ATP-binding protein [Bacteroidales bacterium]|nr:ATP-binding protein [Bacteroidales bacterium]
MDKQLLKQVLTENHKEVESYKIYKRDFDGEGFPCYVFVGIRRAGKSYLLYQRMQELLRNGHGWNEMLYLNFEDERLEGFDIEDFNLILECHNEMYGQRPKMLFLDEIQNINGWDKFARRLADQKYGVWLTGSNAKMLSREVRTTLGGRYINVNVFPYSFKEYAMVHGINVKPDDVLTTEDRAALGKVFDEYFNDGGMPEAALMATKRDYLSSTYQKIYLNDIVARNHINNASGIRLMIKKLAESVRQPISYNRLSRILSSIGGKISVPTIINYVDYCEDAWLLLRLKNLAASFSDRESVCKYYFIDNGIMGLFLFDANPALLENLVALSLFKRFGQDKDDDTVFFYNDKVEVDFYVPSEQWAIQVSYTIQDYETREREVGALTKLPSVLDCRRRIIITRDEETTLQDEHGEIEVLPCWKWLLMLNE